MALLLIYESCDNESSTRVSNPLYGKKPSIRNVFETTDFDKQRVGCQYVNFSWSTVAMHNLKLKVWSSSALADKFIRK